MLCFNRKSRSLTGSPYSLFGRWILHTKFRELLKFSLAQIPNGVSISIANERGYSRVGPNNIFESRAIFIAGLQDKNLMVRLYSIYALGFVGKTSDIPMIEASLVESKKMTTGIPVDREALGLIDETTRKTLEQIRSKSQQKDGKR
jgi:hypothetical protein